MKNILVVAVHPDDETLMCGGTLLKHKADGNQIFWLIITNIDTKNGFNDELIEKRQKEIEKVAELYRFTKIFKLDFPTTKLDSIPFGDLVKSISNVITEIKPNIIYLPNRSDVHTDHAITFKATFSCTKNFRYPFIERILMGETVSETEFAPALNENAFLPNVFIDISDFFDEKIKILNNFESEIMSENYPRSLKTIESLAIWRGS